MRKRVKHTVDLSTPPVDRLFQSDEARTVEDLLEELQETKPKKIRNSTKALEERLFELEVGINVRDNFAERQQMVILKQQEKMDIYERFLQDIEIHYMITKDYRKVQDLIDRGDRHFQVGSHQQREPGLDLADQLFVHRVEASQTLLADQIGTAEVVDFDLVAAVGIFVLGI